MANVSNVLFFSYDPDRRLCGKEAMATAGLPCVTVGTLEAALAVLCSRPVSAAVVDACVRHPDSKVFRTECALLRIPVLELDDPPEEAIDRQQGFAS